MVIFYSALKLNTCSLLKNLHFFPFGSFLILNLNSNRLIELTSANVIMWMSLIDGNGNGSSKTCYFQTNYGFDWGRTFLILLLWSILDKIWNVSSSLCEFSVLTFAFHCDKYISSIFLSIIWFRRALIAIFRRSVILFIIYFDSSCVFVSKLMLNQ